MAGSALTHGGAQAAPLGIVNDGIKAAGESQNLLKDIVYVWGGRNYCWYDDGWQGPGWYVCNYGPWVSGFWWGGGYRWHNWHGGHSNDWYKHHGHNNHHDGDKNKNHHKGDNHNGNKNKGAKVEHHNKYMGSAHKGGGGNKSAMHKGGGHKGGGGNKSAMHKGGGHKGGGHKGGGHKGGGHKGGGKHR